MRLPSGTRMTLLLAFAFALITSEFPEFRTRGKLGNLLLQRQSEGGEDGDKAVIESGSGGGDYEANDGDETEESPRGLFLVPPTHSRTSIVVEATFFFKKHHYRKWGCGGCGGYRRMYYGHHHHYRKHHYGGCHICGKRK